MKTSMQSEVVSCFVSFISIAALTRLNHYALDVSFHGNQHPCNKVQLGMSMSKYFNEPAMEFIDQPNQGFQDSVNLGLHLSADILEAKFPIERANLVWCIPDSLQETERCSESINIEKSNSNLWALSFDDVDFSLPTAFYGGRHSHTVQLENSEIFHTWKRF